jgi:hypothetical protein
MLPWAYKYTLNDALASVLERSARSVRHSSSWLASGFTRASSFRRVLCLHMPHNATDGCCRSTSWLSLILLELALDLGEHSGAVLLGDHGGARRVLEQSVALEARDHVHVRVEDGLPGRRPVVLHDVDAVAARGLPSRRQYPIVSNSESVMNVMNADATSCTALARRGSSRKKLAATSAGMSVARCRQCSLPSTAGSQGGSRRQPSVPATVA